MNALLLAVSLGPSAVPPVEPTRPAGVELQWEAPGACPDEAVMQERIAAELVDPHGEGTLEVEGTVLADDRGFRLELRTTFGALSDSRTLHDPDCQALADSAVLFVAVSLEPATEPEPAPPESPVVTETPTEAPPPLETRTPPPQPAEPPPSSPKLEPTRSRVDAAYVSVAPQLEWGALPGISGGPRVAFGLQWRRASAAAYGFYGALRRTDVVRGAFGIIDLAAGGLRGCVALRPGVLRVPLCGVAEVGGHRVRSRGLTPSNRLSYLWVAAGPHVAVERRWSTVGLFTAAEALGAIHGARVTLGGVDAFETSWVSLRLMIGLRIFFGTESA